VTSTRNRRPLHRLALVALIGLIGAGCGSSAPADTGSAGAGSASTRTPGNTGTSTDENVTDQDQAVKFAECIRAHGVSDFPDPDAKGEFEYGVSVSPAVWKRATTACKDLQPPGALSAERTPEQQSASLRFARCIRDHGVKDFPDPANGEPLVDTTRIPSSDKPGGMTILNAAMHACGNLLGAAAGGQK
jgi:hypothetical protein